MGGNVSKSDYTNINTKLQSMTINAMSSFVSEVNQQNSATNNMTIGGDGSEITCMLGMVVSQSVSMGLSAMGNLDAKASNALSSSLTESISNEITRSLKQQNTGLNLGQANVSMDSTTIKNHLENNMKASLSTGVRSVLSMNTDGSNTLRFAPKKFFSWG